MRRERENLMTSYDDHFAEHAESRGIQIDDDSPPRAIFCCALTGAALFAGLLGILAVKMCR